MRVAWAVALLVGCGRVDFDARTTSCNDASSTGSCSAANPPNLPGCGDGICAAGESCSICSDCRTTAVVCGNGACEAGEDSSSCLVDCGPSPWPWSADEQAAIMELNDFRQSDAG